METEDSSTPLDAVQEKNIYKLYDAIEKNGNLYAHIPYSIRCNVRELEERQLLDELSDDESIAQPSPPKSEIELKFFRSSEDIQKQVVVRKLSLKK